MKTTVDIADALLLRAKRLASRRGTTIRAVIEDALRRELATAESRTPSPVETRTFAGRGLQRGLTWDDWAAIRSLGYEGRGG
jgi:hypothetical protein